MVEHNTADMRIRLRELLSLFDDYAPGRGTTTIRKCRRPFQQRRPYKPPVVPVSVTATVLPAELDEMKYCLVRGGFRCVTFRLVNHPVTLLRRMFITVRNRSVDECCRVPWRAYMPPRPTRTMTAHDDWLEHTPHCHRAAHGHGVSSSASRSNRATATLVG